VSVGTLMVGTAAVPIPLVAQPPTSPAAKIAEKTAVRSRIRIYNVEEPVQVSVFLPPWNNRVMARNEHEQHESLQVYASSPRGFLEDLESVIADVAGEDPERELTRVVGRVEVDAFEAHAGAVKRVNLYEQHPDEPAPRVPVPPKVADLDSVRVGPKEIAIVRIVSPRDRLVVRLIAVAGFLLALGFLLYLLAL
jgi:hypothetical protein